MECVGKFLEAILNGMKMEFVIYGHDISMWQIFVFVIVASIITTIIGGFISE